MATNVNPDLAKERKTATFRTEDLTNIIDGGVDKTKRRRYLEHIIESDPVFDGPDSRFLSREEDFLEAVRKQVACINKIKALGFTDPADLQILNRARSPNGGNSLDFTYIAFIPPIELMGSDAQKQRWLPKAQHSEYIGAYAQTELAHGSFVRGIETRADYDPKTKEFVLSTPTLTATKWWSGGLGLAATHAIVMAQLHTNGKAVGVHPFMLQVRSLDTHKPLPGITVGDIGPKMGFGTIDNGFMRLDNVRIPRDHLLQKSGEVMEDGTYIKPKDSRLVYGGMLGIRSWLPKAAAYNMGKAVVIAIRYSCVRRQSEMKPGEPEPQVLDYQTQQHKLFPLLAGAYAYWFVGDFLVNFHQGVMTELERGDFSRLPEDHVLAAGLKALVNWKVHEGVENCRLSCGGHGYSKASGLPDLYNNQVGNSTAEGETTVLYLQAARYLGKCFMDVQQGKKLDPTVVYLGRKNFDPVNFSRGFDLQAMLSAFQFRTIRLLENVGSKLQKVLIDTGSQHEALQRNAVLLVEVAKAHIEAVIMKTFVDQVTLQNKVNPPIGKVLGRLCGVYAVTEILAHAGDYLQHQYLTKAQLDQLQDHLFSLYTELRPEAVSLVDAFDFSDNILDSILGRYDGQVYENMYKWARESPLNTDEVHESFYKYLQPLKKAKL